LRKFKVSFNPVKIFRLVKQFFRKRKERRDDNLQELLRKSRKGKGKA